MGNQRVRPDRALLESLRSYSSAIDCDVLPQRRFGNAPGLSTSSSILRLTPTGVCWFRSTIAAIWILVAVRPCEPALCAVQA